MPEPRTGLSARSIAVLEMIAAGSNYDQILAAYPDLTYLDIFRAAEEALDTDTGRANQPAYTVAEKRQSHPRAYEKWSETEDGRLRDLYQTGAAVTQIADQLQRNAGAIHSRLVKLGLVDGNAGASDPKMKKS